jgi:hypothetical protein
MDKLAKPVLLALLCAASLLQAPMAAAANHLVYKPDLSRPPDEAPPVTARPRELARKGMGIVFAVVDDAGNPAGGPFTLNTAGATVRLTIDTDAAPPPVTCTATATPAPAACGYVTTSTTPGNQDTVTVYYNGDFPGGKKIAVSVAGVVAGGLAQDPDPAVLHFLTGTQTPRAPASLELVFDISGSMALPSVPGASTTGGCPVTGQPGGMTRLCALQQAAVMLFDRLPGHTMLGDKLGTTFFSTGATGGTLGPAHVPATVDDARSAVLAQVPTAATSIGAGLNLAKTAGFDSDSNTRKFVMLFSDGDQNTAPLVDQDSATCAAASPLKVAGTPYPAGVKVCPITTGEMSACGYKLQQSIGQLACNGLYLHIPASNGTQMPPETFSIAEANMFFTQVLNDALVGDKLEIVREIRGTLTSGTTKTETFLANAGDVALSVLVSWPNLGGRHEINPRVRLFAPDGTEVDTRGSVTRSRFRSSVTTLHFPLRQQNKAIDPKGQWKIELVGYDAMPSQQAESFDYQVIVVADNPKLASSARAAVTDPGTGDAIPIEVRLTDGNAPVAGATVVAALLGPQNGLGDALARAQAPQGQPDLNGDAAGSAARAKLDLLLKDPAFAALLQDKTLPSVTLTADATGVYRGQFGGATKEGNYQFAIVEKGNSSVGEFERIQRLTVFVRPKPAPDNTVLTVISNATQPDNSVLVRLRATARDRFGSLLGPDYGTAFQIRSSIGTVATPLTDNLDGSYDITYRLPSASSNPEFTVVVMGDVAKRASLDELTGKDVTKRVWWLLLLLVLIFVVLIIWLRRRRRH